MSWTVEKVSLCSGKIASNVVFKEIRCMKNTLKSGATFSGPAVFFKNIKNIFSGACCRKNNKNRVDNTVSKDNDVRGGMVPGTARKRDSM